MVCVAHYTLACVVEMKEWMQCICLCFTPSRSVLAESAHLFRSSLSFQLVFFSRARDCMIFTLHDLTYFYIERVTAHRIKKKIIHVFITSGQTPKRKVKLKHFWEQGAPLVFQGPYAVYIFCVFRGSALLAWPWDLQRQMAGLQLV